GRPAHRAGAPARGYTCARSSGTPGGPLGGPALDDGRSGPGPERRRRQAGGALAPVRLGALPGGEVGAGHCPVVVRHGPVVPAHRVTSSTSSGLSASGTSSNMDGVPVT